MSSRTKTARRPKPKSPADCLGQRKKAANDAAAALLEGAVGSHGLFHAKRMFGGVGCYAYGEFMAIIMNGRLFFRVNDETRAKYTKARSKPFEPWPGQVMESYYEVPKAVRMEPDTLAAWAREAAQSRTPRR